MLTYYHDHENIINFITSLVKRERKKNNSATHSSQKLYLSYPGTFVSRRLDILVNGIHRLSERTTTIFLTKAKQLVAGAWTYHRLCCGLITVFARSIALSDVIASNRISSPCLHHYHNPYSHHDVIQSFYDTGLKNSEVLFLRNSMATSSCNKNIDRKAIMFLSGDQYGYR